MVDITCILDNFSWYSTCIRFKADSFNLSLYMTTQLVCAAKQADYIQLMKYSPQQWTQVRGLDKMPQWGMVGLIHFIIYFEWLSKKAYLN